MNTIKKLMILGLFGITLVGNVFGAVTPEQNFGSLKSMPFAGGVAKNFLEVSYSYYAEKLRTIPLEQICWSDDVEVPIDIAILNDSRVVYATDKGVTIIDIRNCEGEVVNIKKLSLDLIPDVTLMPLRIHLGGGQIMVVATSSQTLFKYYYYNNGKIDPDYKGSVYIVCFDLEGEILKSEFTEINYPNGCSAKGKSFDQLCMEHRWFTISSPAYKSADVLILTGLLPLQLKLESRRHITIYDVTNKRNLVDEDIVRQFAEPYKGDLLVFFWETTFTFFKLAVSPCGNHFAIMKLRSDTVMEPELVIYRLNKPKIDVARVFLAGAELADQERLEMFKQERLWNEAMEAQANLADR